MPVVLIDLAPLLAGLAALIAFLLFKYQMLPVLKLMGDIGVLGVKPFVSLVEDATQIVTDQVNAWINEATQPVTDWLGALADTIDAAGSSLEDLSVATADAIEAVTTKVIPDAIAAAGAFTVSEVSGLKREISDVAGQVEQLATSTVPDLIGEVADYARSAVAAVERDLTAYESEAAKNLEQVGEVVLQAAVAHITSAVDPLYVGLGGLEQWATEDVRTAVKWAEQHMAALVTVAGFVATGIPELLTKCESNPLGAAKAFCGLGADFVNALLDAAIPALLLSDIPEIARLIQDAARGMEPELRALALGEQTLVG